MGKKGGQKKKQGKKAGQQGQQGQQDALASCRHDDGFLREQQRLLDLYSAEGARGADEEGDAAERWAEASEAVIRSQQRLLEEAAAAKAVAAGSGGGGGRGEGAGGHTSSNASKTEEVFAVRRVPFNGREVPVLLQSRNGPCALLAVANGLLLRGTLSLGEGENSLSGAQLVSRLANLCEKLNAEAAMEDEAMREAVAQVVRLLPSLLDGLLLNCRFGGCGDFERTAELGLFGLFGLDLYHAWVSPEVAEVAASWNDLAERLALYGELREELEKEGREPGGEEAEALAKGLWLEEWLEETRAQVTPQGLRQVAEAAKETRAQVTPQGLRQVAEAAKDGEICVLFRNNHFCTVYKPQEEALCALLTDDAFQDLTSAVWESVEADGLVGRILNAAFEPVPLEELDGQSLGDKNVAAAGPKADLVRMVQELGFSREQAEAGLAAVDWASVEEAVEALLESQGELPEARSASSSWRRYRRQGPQGPGPQPEEEPVCPTCGKRMNSRAGLLSHRVAKGH